MLFTTFSFWLFFLTVTAAYFSLTCWRSRKLLLLGASYMFYATWNPPFVCLLGLSTYVDWIAASKIATLSRPSARRRWVVISLTLNLGLLGYFKYALFLASNLSDVFDLDWDGSASLFRDLVLPVGISFYTFQTISYTIDIYRGDIERCKSFLDYALYVSFFPQLVAGPIVRAKEFLPQLELEKCLDLRRVSHGMSLIIFGLWQKIFLSDVIFAPAVDVSFVNPTEASWSMAWLGAFSFSGQIFCDFSGYTLIAIGLARILGFSLPRNFFYPYGALGFSDFWRRWHISLSRWLRDYLYISLGGSKKGSYRTAVNLSLTMLLAGFWHGAAWTFAVWGLYHGLLLASERILTQLFRGHDFILWWPMRGLGIVLTFTCVSIGWVLFRAEDLNAALALYSAMLGLSDKGDDSPGTMQYIAGAASLALVAWHIGFRHHNFLAWFSHTSPVIRGILQGVMLFLIFSAGTEGDAFIYFQF